MKQVIPLVIVFILFLVNLGTLLGIGWGAFYPEYDVIILLHVLMTVFFGFATIYGLDDL